MGLFTAASQDEDGARRMTFRARVGALLRRTTEGDDKKFEVSRVLRYRVDYEYIFI